MMMKRECVCSVCGAAHFVPLAMAAADNSTLDRCPFKKACLKIELDKSLLMYDKTATASPPIMKKVTETLAGQRKKLRNSVKQNSGRARLKVVEKLAG
jgi:hypothetical protein